MTHHHLIIIQARGWSTAQDQRAACLALDTTSPDLASWLLFITTLSPCSDATSLHCTTHFLFPFSQLLLKRGFYVSVQTCPDHLVHLITSQKKTSGNHQPKPHSLVCCSQLTVKREKKSITSKHPQVRNGKTKRNETGIKKNLKKTANQFVTRYENAGKIWGAKLQVVKHKDKDRDRDNQGQTQHVTQTHSLVV